VLLICKGHRILKVLRDSLCVVEVVSGMVGMEG